MVSTVSFGKPYASRICSIFPLCMESKAFVKSTNNIVACRFFSCTPSRILRRVNITLKKHIEPRPMSQRELRRIKNEWWSKVYSEIQKAFDKKYLKLFKDFIREVFSALASFNTRLRSRDSIIIIKEQNKSASDSNLIIC